MDYQRIYTDLITRAKHRTTDLFCERHHIIPTCLGGSNDPDNLVRLTPEEHYVAHQLLVKLHPHHKGIIFSARMMGNTRGGNRTYGWLKRKANEASLGRICSPEAKAKISAANKGRKTWAGKSHSDETKAKIGASNTGKRWTDEQKSKLRDRPASNLGVPCSEERRAKLRGQKRTPEQCERISKAKTGQCTEALLVALHAMHERKRGKPDQKRPKQRSLKVSVRPTPENWLRSNPNK